MEMNWKDNMTELGGAFMLSWVVLGTTMLIPDGAGGTIEMPWAGLTLATAMVVAVAWMAFDGAHILPVVTWCHMMTGDLKDGEGNWGANGMRLLAQVIGALLAVILATEAGNLAGLPDTLFADSMNITTIADDYWSVLGMVAAGAIWWQVHTRCETAWVSAIALLGLGGAMTLTGAHYMGASLADGGTEIANVLVNWITDGLFVGLGALLGVKIDEQL